ncbi:CoA ester lyase [Achromobacter sp. NFACC18-2]|uniref:HpcH/HpaI aldolase/citrate lyase family protein n=1 Tax=Achromobacter sp. NFACC18-2 TaxID=1564112 RepID=UPI0008AAC70B|nr:CoA ester lyase [Achromobacter sp. NFACC18-2]SEK11372.1 citrate lyase subunit beta / citryl-CoA lyase [Achromobacter sp. NFACC18-2]
MNRPSRSLLFVPGDRPERYDRAVASGAHEVILDLEDAVAPAAKDAARAEAAKWLANGGQACVRINPPDTPWHEDDLAALRALPRAAVMLPKANAGTLAQALAALPGQRIIALLETVDGYMDLPALARLPGLARIAFGSVDFAMDSGIADQDDAMTPVRTAIALASRHAGLPAPIDGVSLEFNDPDTMRADAVRSRCLGFGGKLCIHPRQVAQVNAAWLPTEAEQSWARRVLEAFEASGGAATAVDGKMIDKPVVEQARGIVAQAGSAAMA